MSKHDVTPDGIPDVGPPVQRDMVDIEVTHIFLNFHQQVLLALYLVLPSLKSNSLVLSPEYLRCMM